MSIPQGALNSQQHLSADFVEIVLYILHTQFSAILWLVLVYAGKNANETKKLLMYRSFQPDMQFLID